MELKRDLSFFDLTNIVVGAIVGADIYVASAITAGLVGPFSLVLWIVAGLFAINLAMVFAYCSYYVPLVGGPFAFVSAAFDDFWGFVAGWSLWIAEILVLPIFALAFVQYLQFFIPLSFYGQVLVKGIFLFAITGVNILGVKGAGRMIDILTIAKLSPLLLLIGVGAALFLLDPAVPLAHFSPLAPLGYGATNAALVLIFWAYVGFEMGTLPAAEVKDPKTTIPKAIASGMCIVIIFYLATNAVIYGAVGWQDLAHTRVPLVLAGTVLLGSIGGIVMSIGALISVTGSDETGVLAIARLSYAMAIDGLFPRVFAAVHPRYGTPYMALLIQGIIAFLLSLGSDIADLISFSVFTMAFSFLLTCLALIVLARPENNLPFQRFVPYAGVAICIYLLASTSIFDKVAGSLVIAAGIPLYLGLSPKVDMHHLKRLFNSEEAIFVRRLEQREYFLANLLWIMHRFAWLLRRRRREHERTDNQLNKKEI